MAKPGTAKLVERFLAGLPQRIAAIQSAVAAADANQIKTLAHQLKGAAGGYGFTPISQAAAQLESAVNSGADAAALAERIAALANLCTSIPRGVP